MDEIKTSINGIKYAPPTKLKDGQRVYSQAILQKIPHNDQEKVDIALKIGRYNSEYSKKDPNKPKTELTLTNEELNALISYLEKYYRPVEIGVDKFISVNSNDEKLVINGFKKLIASKTEVAQYLLNTEIVDDKIYIAMSAIKKIEALKEFELNLELNLPEPKWQKWFNDNKWVLGSDFSEIIDERIIDTKNIADYIMRAYDGFVDLVEIKRPNGELHFWAENKDHDNYIPSTDLLKAITQCLNYIYQIENEANSVKFTERVGAKVIKPRCLLIFGRSNDWNVGQKVAFRILNSAYSQLSILTFDQLLNRAKNIMEIKSEDLAPINFEDELPF